MQLACDSLKTLLDLALQLTSMSTGFGRPTLTIVIRDDYRQLKRGGMPLCLPYHMIQETEDSSQGRSRATRACLASRLIATSEALQIGCRRLSLAVGSARPAGNLAGVVVQVGACGEHALAVPVLRLPLLQQVAGGAWLGACLLIFISAVLIPLHAHPFV